MPHGWVKPRYSYSEDDYAIDEPMFYGLFISGWRH